MLHRSLQAFRPVRAPSTSQRSAVRVMAFQSDAQQTAPRIKLGDTIPSDQVVYVFKKGGTAPEPIKLGEIFRAKKAVMFGLPGAYTSVCSNKHLPEFMSKHAELQQAGVDMLACASVNDAFVMRKWAEDMGVNTAEICMLADGDSSMHRALGLTQTLPGMGERAVRYSMYLDDCVIKVLNIEEPGGMNYKISGPSHMLDDLKKLHESGLQSSATTKAQ